MILSGCAGTIIKSSPKGITEQPDRSGTFYYLPEGKIRVKIEPEKKILKLTVSLLYEPDPNYSYFLEYNPSAGAHDNVTVTLTNTALLQKVSATSKDEVGAILVKVAETVGVAAKLVVAAPFTPTVVPVPKIEQLFDVTVNPTDYHEFIELKENLRKDPYGIEVSIKPLTDAIQGFQNGEPPINGFPRRECINSLRGVCYRPVRPYVLTLRDIETNGKKFLQNVNIYIPNGAPITSFDISRAAFVEKKTELTFENGILTTIQVNKPSEILGAVSVPFDILKAIVAIPAELLTIKVKRAAGEQALLSNQKAILELERQLEELRSKQTQTTKTK